MISKIIRWLILNFFIRPLVYVVMGLHIEHRERLPRKGPAILIANHNSHLDTAVLFLAAPRSIFDKLRPIAAADYWNRPGILQWFTKNILRGIPIERDRNKRVGDPLEPISEALNQGDVILFFPEGSRGNPEELADVKAGIAILAERHPDVPIIPIFFHGLGEALPKDETIFVPVICDMVVGEPLPHYWGDSKAYRDMVTQVWEDLKGESLRANQRLESFEEY